MNPSPAWEAADRRWPSIPAPPAVPTAPRPADPARPGRRPQTQAPGRRPARARAARTPARSAHGPAIRATLPDFAGKGDARDPPPRQSAAPPDPAPTAPSPASGARARRSAGRGRSARPAPPPARSPPPAPADPPPPLPPREVAGARDGPLGGSKPRAALRHLREFHAAHPQTDRAIVQGDALHFRRFEQALESPQRRGPPADFDARIHVAEIAR